jgi:hypothetical protein
MAIDEQTVNKPSAKEKADFEESVISLNYLHAEEEVEEAPQAYMRAKGSGTPTVPSSPLPVSSAGKKRPDGQLNSTLSGKSRNNRARNSLTRPLCGVLVPE